MWIRSRRSTRYLHTHTAVADDRWSFASHSLRLPNEIRCDSDSEQLGTRSRSVILVSHALVLAPGIWKKIFVDVGTGLHATFDSGAVRFRGWVGVHRSQAPFLEAKLCRTAL